MKCDRPTLEFYPIPSLVYTVGYAEACYKSPILKDNQSRNTRGGGGEGKTNKKKTAPHLRWPRTPLAWVGGCDRNRGPSGSHKVWASGQI